MTWRSLGIFELTNDWAYSSLTSSTIFRITHTSSPPQGIVLKAVIGQAINNMSFVFDRQKLGYKIGEEDGQYFPKPDGVELRRLAVRRIDGLEIAWSVEIEELVELSSINLPLPISDVGGLQDALDDKAASIDLIASEQSILAQLSQKSSIGHEHGTAEITGLISLIESLTPVKVSLLPPQNPSVGLQWMQTASNGKLIRRWIWDGSRWVSEIISFNSTHTGTATTTEYLPLSNKYDYHLIDWAYWIRSGRNHNEANGEFLIPRLSFYQSVATTLFTAPEPPLMPPFQDSRNYLHELEIEINTTSTEKRSNRSRDDQK